MARRVTQVASATATGRTSKRVGKGASHGSSVYISGTFSGTYDIDVSHDGVAWFPAQDPAGVAIAQAETTGGMHILGGEFNFISIDVSVFGSGAIVVDHAISEG